MRRAERRSHVIEAMFPKQQDDPTMRDINSEAGVRELASEGNLVGQNSRAGLQHLELPMDLAAGDPANDQPRTLRERQDFFEHAVLVEEREAVRFRACKLMRLVPP